MAIAATKSPKQTIKTDNFIPHPIVPSLDLNQLVMRVRPGPHQLGKTSQMEKAGRPKTPFGADKERNNSTIDQMSLFSNPNSGIPEHHERPLYGSVMTGGEHSKRFSRSIHERPA